MRRRAFRVDRRNLARHGQHQRDRMLGHRDRIYTRRIANSYAAARRGVEIDIIRARTLDRYEAQAGTSAKHGVTKMRVSADIDRDLRSADAARELGLVMGAAFGINAYRAEGSRLFVGGRTFEDRGKIVGNYDHALASGSVSIGAHSDCNQYLTFRSARASA